MNAFQRFLTSRFFTFLAVFLIVFCIASVLLLDVTHPLYIFSIGCGLAIFFLQRYRKKLLGGS
ncbi:hypothetical protein [Daejeonella sp.]